MNENNPSDLRFDSAFTLKVESEPAKPPKVPLSKKDIRQIYVDVGDDCRRAFYKGIVARGLKNHNYEPDDLNQDAYRHFRSVIRKFDKSRYKNVTTGPNIEGAKGAKRISWYFLHYYQQAVNSMTKDNRDKKFQKSGIFTKQKREMENNPVKKITTDYANHYKSAINVPPTEMKFKDKLVEHLAKELGEYPKTFQNFFKDKFHDEISLNRNSRKLTHQEMKEKYPNYRKLTKELAEFIEGFRKKYEDELDAEIFGGV